MTLGLFNLRGSDIEYNPVFFSYSIVTMDDARYLMLYYSHNNSVIISDYVNLLLVINVLFLLSIRLYLLNESALTSDAISQLRIGEVGGVVLRPYKEISSDILQLLSSTEGRVWVSQEDLLTIIRYYRFHHFILIFLD